MCLTKHSTQLLLLIVVSVFGSTSVTKASASEQCDDKRQEVSQYLGLNQKKALLTCTQVNQAYELIHSPKLDISAWEYEGGFRLSTKRAGKAENSTVDFSLGIFSLSTSKK